MEQNNPSQDNEQPVKKLLDPTDKQVHISAKRQARNYTLISKLILRKFNSLELQGIGRAAENVVKLADILQVGELAVIEKIESGVKVMGDNRSESGTKNELMFRVVMGKGKRFDELTKDLK